MKRKSKKTNRVRGKYQVAKNTVGAEEKGDPTRICKRVGSLCTCERRGGISREQKKKEKTNQEKGAAGADLRKKGIPPLSFAKRERVSQCTCERKGRVSGERKEEKN